MAHARIAPYARGKLRPFHYFSITNKVYKKKFFGKMNAYHYPQHQEEAFSKKKA